MSSGGRRRRRPGLWVAVAGIVLIAVVDLGGGRTARADPMSVGHDVDGVYPVASTDVRLVEEEVTIELYAQPVRPGWDPREPRPAYSRVRGEFVFRNEATEGRRVLMAFPVADGEDEDYKARDFRAYLGARELPVTLERTPGRVEGEPGWYSLWYTFSVPFAAGEELRVVNTYWVKNSGNATGGVWVKYILKTGRFWRGPIGKATVTLVLGEIKPYEIVNLFPNNWRFSPDGRTLTWQRESFVPTYDLRVRYNYRDFSDAFLALLRPEDRAPALERRSFFLDLIERAATLSTDELRARYNQAVAEQDPVKATLVRSLLPPEAIPEEPPRIDSLEVLGPGVPLLKVAYSDRDGDIVRFGVAVTHRGKVQTLVDVDEVVARGDYGPAYGGDLQAALPQGPDYRVEVVVEDGLGHRTSRTLDFAAEGTGAPEKAGPAVPFVVWVGGAVATLVVVAAAVSARAAGRARVRSRLGARDQGVTG